MFNKSLLFNRDLFPKITDNEPKVLQELLNNYKELEKEMKENNK